MKRHSAVLLFLLITVSQSCNKNKNETPVPKPDNTDTTATPPHVVIDVPSNVYIAGTQSEDTLVKFQYWNDSKAITIDSAFTASTSPTRSQPTSVFVSGSDVYIGGYSRNFLTPGYKIGQYWKNGIPVPLTDSANSGTINSIFVSDNNVYAAGSEINKLNNIIEYWKNGVAFPLLNAPIAGGALSIFVAGTDVYVAGYDYADKSQNVSAVYWKNGSRVALSNASLEQAKATSIFVSGNDVYVSGFVYTVTHADAVYWKNGVRTVLSPNDSTDERANAIGVSGPDVYVAGSDGYTAKYWKNGSAVNLTDGKYKANTTSLYIANGDVYIAGYDHDTPKYWKNGVEHIIRKELLDESGKAAAIFVTP